jgi:flagellum-specific peptidoglycan hydrolase FlgJ
MVKNTSLLLVAALCTLLLASCKSTNHSTSNSANAESSVSSKKTSETSTDATSDSSSSSSSEKQSSQEQEKAPAPLTFDEGMEILQQSVYSGYLNEDPHLESSTDQQLVIISYIGAKGLNRFTLTPQGTDQVKIHAEIGSAQGGPPNQFNATDHTPEYQTVARPNAATSSSSSESTTDADTTASVPTKFIGKWKKTNRFITAENGKKGEDAYLFHGKADSIMVGETYTDAVGYNVTSCKSLGNNDYVLETEDGLSHEAKTIYLHYYSKDKVGFKTDPDDDYSIFDSREPVMNYDASQW